MFPNHEKDQMRVTKFSKEEGGGGGGVCQCNCITTVCDNQCIQHTAKCNVSIHLVPYVQRPNKGVFKNGAKHGLVAKSAAWPR